MEGVWLGLAGGGVAALWWLAYAVGNVRDELRDLDHTVRQYHLMRQQTSDRMIHTVERDLDGNGNEGKFL